MTVTEYLRRGVELLFMTGWQHVLTSVDEYADTVDQLNRLKARLAGLRVAERE